MEIFLNLNFKPKSFHIMKLEKIKFMDFDTATKTSGSRFVFLKKD